MYVYRPESKLLEFWLWFLSPCASVGFLQLFSGPAGEKGSSEQHRIIHGFTSTS